MSRSLLVRAIVVTIVAMLTIGGVAVLRAPDGATTMTLQFTDTTGLYVGNDVQTIGVRVGRVTAIEPHGSRVDVTIEVDDTPVAADAGALIMQSSLVTDRFIELTPPWSDGPKLRDGAVIPVDRTRSPANVDDILASVDDLVVALKDTTTDGKDIGDLLRVGAEQLDGKGRKIADALESASAALGTVDGKDADLTAIVDDLDSLVSMLAKRDSTIRRLSGNVTSSTQLMADQRKDLGRTLQTLDSLSARMTSFVRENRTLVKGGVSKASRVLTTIEGRRDDLAEIFDTMPLVAENISRAYDPETRNLRVRLDIRRTGPLNNITRNDLCRAYLVSEPELCDQFSSSDGTGFLDPILEALVGVLPEDL